MADEGSDPKAPGMERRSSSQPEHFHEALGRAIKVLRTAHGLGRRELAELAGLSYSYLTEIENGTKQPSSKVLRTIGEALSVPASELMQTAETWRSGGDVEDGSLLGGLTRTMGRVPAEFSEAPPTRWPLITPWPKRPRRWLPRKQETDAQPDSVTPRQKELLQRFNNLSPDDQERVLDLAYRLGDDES